MATRHPGAMFQGLTPQFPDGVEAVERALLRIVPRASGRHCDNAANHVSRDKSNQFTYGGRVEPSLLAVARPSTSDNYLWMWAGKFRIGSQDFYVFVPEIEGQLERSVAVYAPRGVSKKTLQTFLGAFAHAFDA